MCYVISSSAQNPGLEDADDFNCFTDENLEEIRERVNDEEFIFNMYDVSHQYSICIM